MVAITLVAFSAAVLAILLSNVGTRQAILEEFKSIIVTPELKRCSFYRLRKNERHRISTQTANPAC